MRIGRPLNVFRDTGNLMPGGPMAIALRRKGIEATIKGNEEYIDNRACGRNSRDLVELVTGNGARGSVPRRP
jgi:hypothetical protein